ncbi:hypothetical protein VNO80_33117 [Phaseolus coccineus]|uniref:Uncharacterized protein n=1 Tax=Phaseolus coccineus TaxID=3886 RepID=A0AAN9Q8X2_PHACN
MGSRLRRLRILAVGSSGSSCVDDIPSLRLILHDQDQSVRPFAFASAERGISKTTRTRPGSTDLEEDTDTDGSTDSEVDFSSDTETRVHKESHHRLLLASSRTSFFSAKDVDQRPLMQSIITNLVANGSLSEVKTRSATRSPPFASVSQAKLPTYAQDVLRSQQVIRSWATLLARSKLRSIPNDTCSVNLISSAFRQLEIEARGSQASNCGCAIWGAQVKFHFTVLLEVKIGDYRSLTQFDVIDAPVQYNFADPRPFSDEAKAAEVYADAYYYSKGDLQIRFFGLIDRSPLLKPRRRHQSIGPRRHKQVSDARLIYMGGNPLEIDHAVTANQAEIRLAFQRADIRGLTPKAPEKLYDIRSEVQDDVIEVNL